MNLAEHPQMYGLHNSMCARTLHESEVVISLINNSAPWTGLTDKIGDKLQDFQNKFMLRTQTRDPQQYSRVRLKYAIDENRIMLNKLTYKGKIMA